MVQRSILLWTVLGSAAALAACSSGGFTAAPPVSGSLPQSGTVTDSYTQSGSNISVTGPITAILTSTEFSVNAGTGCGTIHVYTSSSTAWSPSGAKAVVAENVTASGTGSCATNVQASSVKVISTPAPTPTPGTTATPSPLPASRTIGGGGSPFGLDDTFNPTDGDTATGGNGQTVDGIPCATTMPNTYHVHAFVGIIINGRQYAIPDGVGLNKPGADGTYAGFTNWTEYASSCYYYMHTHDASGVMHIEAPNSVPQSTSLYTLQNFFDVWGQKISSSQIGPFTGTVTAYVAQVPLKTAQITSSMYSTYSGNPAAIPLKSHTTVWLQIGPKIYTPSQLPVLNYYEEY